MNCTSICCRAMNAPINCAMAWMYSINIDPYNLTQFGILETTNVSNSPCFTFSLSSNGNKKNDVIHLYASLVIFADLLLSLHNQITDCSPTSKIDSP